MGLAIFIRLLEILIVVAGVYLVARLVIFAFLKNEEKNRETLIRKETTATLFPLKLQASERLILFLERMTPAQAINRAMQPGMTAIELQMTLVKNIREEYEHNTAQQLYISPGCWALVKNAKEEVIRVINLAVSESGEGATGADVAKTLLLSWSVLDTDPVQTAISQIKSEI